MAVVLVTVVSGCSNASRVTQLLRPGVVNADTAFTEYADDLGKLAREDAIVVPAELDDAVRQTQSEVANGTKLTEDEAAWLARGEQLVAAYTKLDQFTQLAFDWSLAIPDEAIRLVSASMYPDSSPAFRADLEVLQQRVMRALMCNATRAGLDEIGEQQAAEKMPDYDVMGLNFEDIGNFLYAGLDARWDGIEEAVDLVALSANTVSVHNSYVNGILDIAESPSGAIAAANVVYFRNCVV